MLPSVVFKHLFLQLGCQYHALQMSMKVGKTVKRSVELTCVCVCVWTLALMFYACNTINVCVGMCVYIYTHIYYTYIYTYINKGEKNTP